MAEPKTLGIQGRLECFTKHWKKIFAELNIGGVEFTLQMEISTPYDKVARTRQIARLHFHGLIRFPDAPAFLWFHLYGITLLEKICTFEIDTISDPRVWYDYCHEQSFLSLEAFASDIIDPRSMWTSLLGEPLESPNASCLTTKRSKHKTRVKRSKKHG